MPRLEWKLVFVVSAVAIAFYAAWPLAYFSAHRGELVSATARCAEARNALTETSADESLASVGQRYLVLSRTVELGYCMRAALVAQRLRANRVPEGWIKLAELVGVQRARVPIAQKETIVEGWR